MDISVILATYKRPQILSKTLESFCALNTDGLQWEVFVVDNAGDPDSQKTVEGFQRQLPLRFFVEKTPGKNNALNHAIKKARGELFVFTDDDIVADKNWLKEIWARTQRWPDIEIFGGKILPYNLEIIPEEFQKLRSYSHLYGVADWDCAEGVYDLMQIYGANMVVRSKIFADGLRLNENIFTPEDIRQFFGLQRYVNIKEPTSFNTFI